jgi:hypothetical protein
MADYVFKKDDAGIRRLLQSQECLACMEKFAQSQADGGELKPFIGFDRAKVFVNKRIKK